MRAKKGISPILATVVLIAVTLVIAVGVIGWVMGIWGSMGKTESLRIISGNITVPGSSAAGDSATLNLDVINQGTADAIIHKVVVAGQEFSEIIVINPDGDRINTKTIPADGKIYTIEVDLGTKEYSPGVSYSVTVITRVGNQYPFVVQAVLKSQ
jgi:flagellin-like protein